MEYILIVQGGKFLAKEEGLEEGGREEEKEGRRAMGKGKQEMRDLSRLFS